MSELFEKLPEVGDPPKPKLVFFFDEAHLLFNEAPKALLDKVEQVVRLIRSKGVGVYFVTQNPLDVPDKVLAQLGNRVQHALRAFTPRDQKAVAAAAETFRPNPKLNTAQVITQLGKGEALVSFLEGNGTPAMVDRTLIRPPSARIGPVTPEERKAMIDKSPLKGKYDQTIDPKSAYEILQKRLPDRGRCPVGRIRPAGAGAGAGTPGRLPAQIGLLSADGRLGVRRVRDRPPARNGVDDDAIGRPQCCARGRGRRRDAGRVRTRQIDGQQDGRDDQQGGRARRARRCNEKVTYDSIDVRIAGGSRPHRPRSRRQPRSAVRAAAHPVGVDRSGLCAAMPHRGRARRRRFAQPRI